MPTKLTVAPSFHRQVIVVFVCVPASLPRECSRPGERFCLVMSCVNVELVSLSVELDRECRQTIVASIVWYVRVVCLA